MLYIEKNSPSKEAKEEIQALKRSEEWKKIDSSDTKAVREIFDRLNKEWIRLDLLREQKHICGYCMRRIKNDGDSMIIEHMVPVSGDKERALDYKNMIGVCRGGRKKKGDIDQADENEGIKQHRNQKRILCCDASKEDETEMYINPYDREQMRKICYKKNGRIYTEPKDDSMDYDINYVLKLNGDVNKNGEILSDTFTQLVYGRKKTYEECEAFLEKLNKKGKCTSTMIKKKLDEIKTAEKQQEFAGVMIFFLEKKYRELAARSL